MPRWTDRPGAEVMRSLLWLQVGIAVYEAVVWTVDLPPFTAHQDPFDERLLPALINSVPHLLLGAMAFSCGFGPLVVIYTAYIFVFTAMQAFFWWLPYLFDLATADRVAHFEAELSAVISILPPLRATPHIIPSLEHTLLFPASLAACFLSAKFFLVSERVWRSHAVQLLLWGSCLSLVPLLMYEYGPWENEVAALVAAGLVVGATLLTVILKCVRKDDSAPILSKAQRRQRREKARGGASQEPTGSAATGSGARATSVGDKPRQRRRGLKKMATQ